MTFIGQVLLGWLLWEIISYLFKTKEERRKELEDLIS